MIQKIVGLTLCVLAVILAWWFFVPPRSLEIQQNTPDPALAIQVRPLLVTAAHWDEASQLEPVTPKNGGDEAGETKPPATVNLTPLTNAEIENELSQYQRQFQNCWVQRLKDLPQLKGRVVFRLTLTPRGRVAESQVSQSDVEDTLMLQCLTSTLNRIEFREFKGDPIEILFPLEFSR